MTPRPRWTAACVLLFATSVFADEPGAKKPTFYVVPHTHWEGAVFKTREEYLEMGLPNILKALKLLREQPTYKFTLDQVAYFRPFLERYPEEEADFRRFIADGRLQIVGALDVMPDDNMPGGETFVRQIQYGKGYCRDKLGVDVTTGWLVDTFGHHAQMPQLMALGGFKTFWFVRGVPKQEHPSEFFWEGIDGTKIPAFYLPHSYGLMFGAPRDISAFRGFAKGRYDMLTPNARGSTQRVGLAGVDVSVPEEQLAPVIEEYNKDANAPLTLHLAVPADYEAAHAQREGWPVFKGELNPIFQGTYSSRIELKEWMRSNERRLLNAEKLGALAGWLGTPPDRTSLWRAWEPVLFNETHDLASGVMTDHVYDDTVGSHEFSRRLADELAQASWETIAAKIDTRGEGVPVVVFNPLGWTRSDIAEVTVGFDDGKVNGIVLTDDREENVPVQLLETTRYPGGGLQTARLAFVASDIPALGYRTYYITPGPAALTGDTPAPGRLENELYRLAIDPATGAITSLRAKKDDWEVFAGHGNVVSREEDRGDFWEPFHGLDGGSRVAMTTKTVVPKKGSATLSDEPAGKPGTTIAGPVLSEFRVAHALGSGQFQTAVRLYNGLRRIDVVTTLVNQEKYVRYRALFPTTIAGGKNVHEIPFGAIERPDAIEFPAQNWVDQSDGSHGLAILNVGLPGNVATGGTMMVSLLRAHTLGAYGFGGGYEPGMSSESGLQLGKERTLRYSLVPHAGDWREAGVYRDGLELNHPLLCRKVLPHAGPLPKRWGLLEVSKPNVVVSALQPGRDGHVLLRVYEAAGKATPGVEVSFNAPVRSARVVNLLDDAGEELTAKGDRVRFDLHPFEIKTVRLGLGPKS
ncbi:MAG: glycoside hydrolase family 38 C-terminal domain-containing protein [Isosphaeraceae bacterium]|nr:glycoside hydrolase family 38 C-terminal domain-containing protein [Isosphaeraceae bacterium]